MVDDLIDILRRSRRSSAVADVLSGRPADVGPVSCMGGAFYGAPGESWPTNDHGLMIPLLQIVVPALPVVPESLAEFSLLTVFLDRTDMPPDGQADNGDGWLLRAYRAVDTLVPLKSPPDLWAGEYPKDRRHVAFDKQFPPRVTRLSWRRSDADDPNWESFGALMPRFDWDFDELHPRYEAISTREYGTKVGGWPTSIQDGGAVSEGEFAFQVATLEKARVMIGDNGNVYVFRTPDGWQMTWDCY
jgi:hypothetical protein